MSWKQKHCKQTLELHWRTLAWEEAAFLCYVINRSKTASVQGTNCVQFHIHAYTLGSLTKAEWCSTLNPFGIFHCEYDCALGIKFRLMICVVVSQCDVLLLHVLTWDFKWEWNHSPFPNMHIPFFFVSIPELKPWGSPSHGWEGSACYHFPTPVHIVAQTSAELPATGAAALPSWRFQ